MREVLVFNNVSIDGYFTDAESDMSFARNGAADPEWDAFVAGNAGGNGTLVFGRATYQMMASFWTTPKAAELLPKVAEGMNRMKKLVFSRTLKSVSWNGATLAQGDPVDVVRGLKKGDGEGLVILGSGSIVAQLAAAGLVDAYQLAVVPVALGRGRTMFDGLPRRLPLKLKASRSFRNGNVLLTYAAA